MNRVRVIIERDAPGNEKKAGHVDRYVAQRTFEGWDFTLHDVLNVVEDALRGAGYNCPFEHLDVIADDEA